MIRCPVCGEVDYVYSIDEYIWGKWICWSCGYDGSQRRFIDSGLAPQKVVDVTDGNATRDTYQRKVFYDGRNFFVILWSGAPIKAIQYVASGNGILWTVPSTMYSSSTFPYVGGNADCNYPNRGAKDSSGNAFDVSMTFLSDLGTTIYFYPYVISGKTLTLKQSSGSGTGTARKDASIFANMNGSVEIWVTHHQTLAIEAGKWGSRLTYSDGIPYTDALSGGAQILGYQSASPYDFLVLVKGGDHVLYSNTLSGDGNTFRGVFSSIVTLGSGFSDFCGATEAQTIGDPQKVHIVYIKSSGQLCYNNFESGIWGTETILESSGATYPVITCGKSGKLYVLYVKNNKIWFIRFNKGKWFNPVELFTKDHIYNNPAYLSTNQNVQHGKICLVWTEGVISPYGVWFCYFE